MTVNKRPVHRLDDRCDSLLGGVSRRALLRGTLAAIGGLLVSNNAFAQLTTSESALQGEALETGPDTTLVAKFATYELDLEYGVNADGSLNAHSKTMKSGRFTYKSRTFAQDGVVDDNFLGPVLEVKPGQTFSIRIINELFETAEYQNIGPPEPKPEDWFYLIDREKGPFAGLRKLDPLGFPMANTCDPNTDISNIKVDWVNVPKNFNWTNLHTHGLQVTPHLFEPEGTLNAKSDYITIKPGEDKTYLFALAEDHPSGTFWYHTHRHNSVAIQAWSGMAGLILVRGRYDEELRSFGITTEIPFVVHDPHYDPVSLPQDGAPGVASMVRFVAEPSEARNYTFMVTGHYRPEYTVKRNEVVLLRHLTATVENLCGFRIVRRDEAVDGPPSTDDVNQPFWIIASDGIAYDKPVRRDLMVTGGGERNDILIQLPEPGVYEIWSDRCETIQYFGIGPKPQLLATIQVTDEEASGQADISEMAFTPGIAPENDITEEEIVRRRHFVLDLENDTCRFPFPQFKINDRDYRPDESYFDVKAGTVEEWVISNPSAGTHPFHVHVNPFQVKERYSALGVRDDLVPETDRSLVASRIEAMSHIHRPNMWRDSVIVPPKGMVRIWIRFDEKLVGKTVFHCHFLVHEETGMLQNFTIVP